MEEKKARKKQSFRRRGPLGCCWEDTRDQCEPNRAVVRLGRVHRFRLSRLFILHLSLRYTASVYSRSHRWRGIVEEEAESHCLLFDVAFTIVHQVLYRQCKNREEAFTIRYPLLHKYGLHPCAIQAMCVRVKNERPPLTLMHHSMCIYMYMMPLASSIHQISQAQSFKALATMNFRAYIIPVSLSTSTYSFFIFYFWQFFDDYLTQLYIIFTFFS